MQMQKRRITLIALMAMLSACVTHDAKQATHQDTRGNYATTAKFNAMERGDFTRAMHDGLNDFDLKLKTLELQAEKLGPEAMEEYHDRLDELTAQRREFAAELARHEAMLADEWRDKREDVAEQYVALRENLDETFEEVIDEA